MDTSSARKGHCLKLGKTFELAGLKGSSARAHFSLLSVEGSLTSVWGFLTEADLSLFSQSLDPTLFGGSHPSADEPLTLS